MGITRRATALTATALTTALTAALIAGGTATAAPAPATPDARNGHPGVQRVLDRAVTEGGVPGIVAEVRDGHRAWFGTAGVADLTTGRPRHAQERFRIGSTTKTFVATVVLQLAAEGRLDLDDSVERWLPGLVDGPGYEPDRITVRQLLGMTSGVYNYAMDAKVRAENEGTGFLLHRFDTYTPEQLVRTGTANRPDFAPGAGWTYSDTGYVLAGLIVERATGTSLAEQVDQRVITPLGLSGTYTPDPDDTALRGPHARAYSRLGDPSPTAPVHDVTELSPSWGYAAGDMVSTARDLDTFFAALLGGRLLPPAQQRELLTMVPTPPGAWIPNAAYGLGVGSVTLDCGPTLWGMGGAINGSWTYTFGTRDGGHLLTTNINGDWTNGSWPIAVFTSELEAEFCPRP
ncbi:serine hydrolase domain-containing protein [Kitasatospora sp. NPDC058046]|uniref:serine hydrolase domain-containing protein n=1 Tax=Kitasatospora sp. NPDC058046 TaxID=3346312 RepID=UPI0036DEAEBC